MITGYIITFWVTGNDFKQYSMEVYAKDRGTAEQLFCRCFRRCNIISTKRIVPERERSESKSNGLLEWLFRRYA